MGGRSHRGAGLSREEAAQAIARWIEARVRLSERPFDDECLAWLARDPDAEERPPAVLLYELIALLASPDARRWLRDERALRSELEALDDNALSGIRVLVDRVRASA